MNRGGSREKPDAQETEELDRRLTDLATRLPDVAHGFAALLIEEVLEGVCVHHEQHLVGDVLHEGGRPFDAGDGDDGLDRILADGVEHGEFAHLLEDAGPERHCLVALFSLVPVVDAVVFLVEFRPDAPRWTQRLTFALFRRSHTVHYGDRTF